MPPELLKAHQNNDRAVMEAYGLPVKTTTERDAVAFLFDLYSKLIKSKDNYYLIILSLQNIDLQKE